MTTFARKRIQGLRELQPGWWGMHSVPPAPVLLDDLETLLPFLEAHEDIAFTANSDGDIIFEWITQDGHRYHTLEYNTESIWSYSWSDPSGEDDIEVTLPYSIAQVHQLLENSLA